MQKTIEIDRIRFYKEDTHWFIAETTDGEVITGECVVEPSGKMTIEYTNTEFRGEKQLKISKIFFQDTRAIRRMLISSGFLAGIQRKKAVAMEKALGDRLFEVLDAACATPPKVIDWGGVSTYAPSILMSVKGIKNVVAQQIMDSWRDRSGQAQAAMLAIRCGLSTRQYRAAVMERGYEGFSYAVMQNPYSLTTVTGFAWKDADDIALLEWEGKAKVAWDSPTRIQAAVRETLRLQLTEGDTMMLTSHVDAIAADLCGIPEIMSQFDFENSGVKQVGDFVMLKRWWDIELSTATRLNELMMTGFRKPIGAVIDYSLFTDGITLNDEQREAINVALHNNVSIITGGPGCLAGDTIININRAGRGFQIRIDELERNFNREAPYLKGHNWDLSIPTYVARNVNGIVRLGLLKSAWQSGNKQTYEIVTETGRRIRGTYIHPFMLPDGEWKQLGELNVGDRVCVNAGKTNVNRVKKGYLTRATRYHPFQLACNRKDRNGEVRTGFDVSLHRLVFEANMNDMSLDEYLYILNHLEITAKTLMYLPREVVIHHKDFNERNNDLSNLEEMSQSTHAFIHSLESKNNVLDHIEAEVIIAKSKCYIEETYDIEVDDDPHNFLANGFVVHNTGKTTILNTLLNIFDAYDIDYALCAPTGAAKSRITQATGREASTLHRQFALFQDPDLVSLGEDVLVIDESSMLSADILEQVMRCVDPGQKVIFVGDGDQLPPVGPGEPLLQMLDAMMPQVMLKQIYRQAANSGIISAAHNVLNGQTPVGNKKDFIILRADKTTVRERIMSAVDWLQNQGLHFEDIQLLSPINKGAEFGRHGLNEFMQKTYNSDHPLKDKQKFTIDDPVIHIVNNYQLGVMNGDIGILTREFDKDALVEDDMRDDDGFFVGEDPDKKAVLEVNYPMQGLIKYDEDQAMQLNLAYCITIHKSQGSQFPAVIIVMPWTAPMFYMRQLPYTGITRAQKYCILISEGYALEAYLKSEKKARRMSMLSNFISVVAGKL